MEIGKCLPVQNNQGLKFTIDYTNGDVFVNSYMNQDCQYTNGPPIKLDNVRTNLSTPMSCHTDNGNGMVMNGISYSVIVGDLEPAMFPSAGYIIEK